MYRWHEPGARPGTVVLLGTAAAGLLSLAVMSLVVGNWDLGVVTGVLGLAAAADLARDLRPRAFVLAGEDGLVVSTGRRTVVVGWAEVVRLRVHRRRWRRDRPVLDRADGTTLVLPREVPLEALARQRPGGAEDAARGEP